jgi:hypothetical protein
MKDLEQRLSEAVAFFWHTRLGQQERQGVGGTKDAGNRGSVTGGAHLDGFIKLVRTLLVEGGLIGASVYPNVANSVLPGYFRPCKEWDLVVVIDSVLVATLEFKSQVGSFGNNFNNRVEEAIGNAVDLHTAYREGAFAPSPAPWLGYMMILEDCPKSSSPVKVEEPHFKVFEEWRGASYAKRYEIFCQKLVRERIYNSACFVTSTQAEGMRGKYHEPNAEIGFRKFAASLIGHATSLAQMGVK